MTDTTAPATTSGDVLDLDAITSEVFAAAERGEWDRFASFFAPEATIRQNVTSAMTLDEALVVLPATGADGSQLRYENVRRFVGDDHVTELHDAVFTKPDGRRIAIDICVVIRFDAEARIVQVDEYLDSAAAAALFS